MGRKRNGGGNGGSPSNRGKVAMLLPFMRSPSDNPIIPDAKGAYLVENHPFKIDTLLFIGGEGELRNCLKRRFGAGLEGVEVDFGAIDGVAIPCKRPDGSQFVLIYLPRFQWTASHIAVLAHEVVHSSVFILKMSGVHNSILEGCDEDDSDDECLAHLVDSQMEELLSKLASKAVRRLPKTDSI